MPSSWYLFNKEESVIFEERQETGSEGIKCLSSLSYLICTPVGKQILMNEIAPL